MMTFMLKKTTPRHTRAAGAPDRPRSPLDAARGTGLGGLVERAQWLDAIDRTLRLALPPQLARHCRLGNVRGGTLVFLVESPVWKAKLRLHAEAVLAAARELDIPADELLVKVSAAPPGPKADTPPRPLSDHARACLRSAAEAVKDPELREKLLALASVP
jgi:hypothetical protein